MVRLGDWQIGSYSRADLLARIAPYASAPPQPGGSIAIDAQGSFVVSIDVLLENVHFRADWSSGADVGARAAMQNLADIAAMGARPTTIVVGLLLNEETALTWFDDVARGMSDVCKPLGVDVVFADITGTLLEDSFISITVLGALDGRAPVTRSGAAAGDILAVAGSLGRSAAGLASLTAKRGDDPRLAPYVSTFRRPVSPLAAGIAASGTAMMDVSDGLVIDGTRLAKASGVTLDIDSRLLQPYLDDLAPAADVLGHDALDWVLTGGEDHALLATFRGHIPDPFREVGRVVDRGAEPVMVDGSVPASQGWDHFGGATLPDAPAAVRVGDLSERDLIARCVAVLPSGTSTTLGTGDDAAVIAAPNGQIAVAVRCRSDRPGSPTYHLTGYDAGVELAQQVVSDVRAAGARPTAMVVGMAIHPDTSLEWFDGVARGLASVCEPLGIGVVGGDLARRRLRGADLSATVFGDR